VERAEFEEKQYETGLAFELAANSPLSFSSGHLLEGTLGYDFAVEPGKLTIWKLLRAACPPASR